MGKACARSNMCEKYSSKASIWYPVNRLSVWRKGEKIARRGKGKIFSPYLQTRSFGSQATIWKCSRCLQLVCSSLDSLILKRPRSFAVPSLPAIYHGRLRIRLQSRRWIILAALTWMCSSSSRELLLHPTQ